MRIDTLHLAEDCPEAPAIRHRGVEYSFAQLEDMVRRYTGFLMKAGVKKGDRVAISSPNCPEFIFSYWAAVRLGALVVPLNLFFTLEEMGYVLKNSGSEVLIVHPYILEKVDASALSGLGLRMVIVLDQAGKEEIKKTEPVDIESRTAYEDPAAIMYTSGTTGRPKGAVLTHKNLVSDVYSLAKATYIGPHDNFLCVLPMFHSFAWTVCVLLPLYRGGTVVILESFQPGETIKTIVEERITFLLGVPPMYMLLLKKAEPEHLKGVHLAVSGGASLPREIFTAFTNKFAVNFIEGYGLTEAAPVVCINPVDGVKKAGSIGLPLPDIDVIVGDEHGTELSPGKVGEILVKGDNVMQGYYNDPGATAETFLNGWLRTGDLAVTDADGYIFIVDRKKDMIIVGGFNVYPREIEEVLYCHPKVAEAAVIGVEDSIRGETPKAFVVVKEGEELTQKEVMGFLKERLALYKLPRVVEFRDSLPKNATGKVLKKLLG